MWVPPATASHDDAPSHCAQPREIIVEVGTMGWGWGVNGGRGLFRPGRVEVKFSGGFGTGAGVGWRNCDCTGGVGCGDGGLFGGFARGVLLERVYVAIW